MFVAVWPDAGTRDALGGLPLTREKGLRLVGPSRWHVTLRFLGDVGDEVGAAVGSALVGAVGAVRGPVVCRIGPATDWFHGVRVLQLPVAGLDSLAEVVRGATLPLVPETGRTEAFNGHLTLARAKGKMGQATRAALAGLAFEREFLVGAVDLVASEPTPEGHRYTTVMRAELA